jgi:hypothetical protein
MNDTTPTVFGARGRITGTIQVQDGETVIVIEPPASHLLVLAIEAIRQAGRDLDDASVHLKNYESALFGRTATGRQSDIVYEDSVTAMAAAAAIEKETRG